MQSLLVPWGALQNWRMKSTLRAIISLLLLATGCRLGCAAGALSTAAPGGTASAPDMPTAAKLASTARIT